VYQERVFNLRPVFAVCSSRVAAAAHKGTSLLLRALLASRCQVSCFPSE